MPGAWGRNEKVEKLSGSPSQGPRWDNKGEVSKTEPRRGPVILRGKCEENRSNVSPSESPSFTVRNTEAQRWETESKVPRNTGTKMTVTFPFPVEEVPPGTTLDWVDLRNQSRCAPCV